MMKKILSLLLAGVMVFCFAACGNSKDETPEKEKSERKRATAGQDTTTSTAQPEDQVVLDTGMLTALDKTYAQSNKAGIVYDTNVFLKLAQSSSKTVKIACVGDDMAYGAGSSDVLKKSYPTQLQKLLDARFGKGKFEVKNYGKSGSYVADFERSDAGSLRYCYTDEYRKMRKSKPDVVIMMLGTNDIGYLSDGNACEEYKDAYVELLKDIKGLSSKPLVFVCTPIARYTAYSSYVAMPYLKNATVKAANEAGVYVIDTYNITKEYFSSALYENDGFHPDDDGYYYLADTIMGGIADGLTEYKEGKLSSTSDYVVFVSSTGEYDSVGATPDKPTSSFARAVELCQGGGTIVICGQVTPTEAAVGVTRPAILPENYNKIKVTSVWNGVDYRKDAKVNAKIYLSSSIYLNGDFEFENVTFETVAAATKIVCNYNNVTFNTGFSTVDNIGGHSVLIVGHDIVSKWQSGNNASCLKNCDILVKSGTFTYLRGGNYRAYATGESKYAYGTVKKGVTINITVDGATFNRGDSAGNHGKPNSTLSSALGQNGMEKGSTINLVVNSGTFMGSVFAVPRMNPYPASGLPTVAGNINITLNGGRFNGQTVGYNQTFTNLKDSDGKVTVKYRSPKLTGKFNLTVNAKDFTSSAKKSLTGTGCSAAKVTLGENFPEGLFTIKGFKNYK